MPHMSLALHYPKPEHVDDLLGAMARLGTVLAGMPGLLDVGVWRNEELIVAMAIWESPEALEGATPAMVTALADVPFGEWELRQQQLFGLEEVEIQD